MVLQWDLWTKWHCSGICGGQSGIAVGFVDKVALQHDFLRVLRFSLPVLDTHPLGTGTQAAVGRPAVSPTSTSKTRIVSSKGVGCYWYQVISSLRITDILVVVK